jgi:hypothetical protein
MIEFWQEALHYPWDTPKQQIILSWKTRTVIFFASFRSQTNNETNVTSVRNWNSKLEATGKPYAHHQLPLAGFSLIEAESLNEVIDFVKNTPCPRGKGEIEIRPFWDLSEAGA